MSGTVPLVEVIRSGIVESVHMGAVAVVDAAGNVRWSAGDPSLVTFPRSSLKPFQEVALIARGGVQRFGLNPQEIAVMAGSHGGEPVHVETVLGLLQKIDAPADALMCGAQTPTDATAAQALARSGGTPAAVHNNCSGKHAGMLALARLLDAPLDDYINPDHPAQLAIRATLVDLLQLEPSKMTVGMDGCSAPAFAVPLEAMARGYALLANPTRALSAWHHALQMIGSAMRA
jgi:L-asparaginase II